MLLQSGSGNGAPVRHALQGKLSNSNSLRKQQSHEHP